MPETVNRFRSGGVTFQDPFGEAKVGCKKKKKKIWGCVLLRRSRAHSDPGPSIHHAEGAGSSGVYPSLPHDGARGTAAVPLKQPRSSLGSILPACETDFYDGSPKMWKQSKRFFCDETVYHRQRESVIKLEEELKIWLESLALKSKSARDRFNGKILKKQQPSSDPNISVAPLRITTKVKPSPFAGKSDAQNPAGDHSDRSNIRLDYELERANQMYLSIPSLQRVRRNESPRSFSPPSEGINGREGSIRLVSAWSSDTLSILAAENPENYEPNTRLGSPSSQREENFSIGISARELEVN